jgi:hypothetical protein
MGEGGGRGKRTAAQHLPTHTCAAHATRTGEGVSTQYVWVAETTPKHYAAKHNPAPVV